MTWRIIDLTHYYGRMSTSLNPYDPYHDIDTLLHCCDSNASNNYVVKQLYREHGGKYFRLLNIYLLIECNYSFKRGEHILMVYCKIVHYMCLFCSEYLQPIPNINCGKLPFWGDILIRCFEWLHHCKHFY